MENLRTLWDNAAHNYHDLPAVRWLEKKEIKEATYGDLNKKVENIRAGLAAGGFNGAHIALIGESSLSWIASYLGIVTGNNVAVPLDALLPAEDLIELLVRAEVQVLFVSPKLMAIAEPAIKSCKTLKQVWILQDSYENCGLTGEIGSLRELENLGQVKIDGISTKVGDSKQDRLTVDSSLVSEDDLATIIFTSGTTGKSKGVMLTHKNLYENVENVNYVVDPGCVMMSVLPIHHAYCLVMDWLKGFSLGAIVCINDSFMHMVRNMHIFKPTVILMVPLMIESIYKRLAASAEEYASADENTLKMVRANVYENIFGGNLKIIFTGGAHLDPFYIDEFAKFGIDILEGYGMSECSPVITTNTPDCHRPGSIGKPLANVEIKFENGEILVRGTSVMQGYYHMPEETESAFTDGWLHTGDKGYLDEDGYLYINGRVKNLIIMSNGENISPEEIENKLSLNPLIAEVIITGNGTGLTANIYPDQDIIDKRSLSPETIQQSLQDFIDAYNLAQPSYRHITNLVIRTQPFIRNTTGKIKRTEIA